MKRSIVNVGCQQFLVDTSSGEVLAEAPSDGIVFWLKPRDFRKAPFCMATQQDLLRLASCELSPTAWRLLIFLFGFMQFENWIEGSQTEIAARLGLSRQAVSKAFKVLTKQKLILLQKTGMTSFRWRVQPALIWRGHLRHQANAISDVIANGIVPSDEQIKCSLTPCGKLATEGSHCLPSASCDVCENDIAGIMDAIESDQIEFVYEPGLETAFQTE